MLMINRRKTEAIFSKIKHNNGKMDNEEAAGTSLRDVTTNNLEDTGVPGTPKHFP